MILLSPSCQIRFDQPQLLLWECHTLLLFIYLPSLLLCLDPAKAANTKSARINESEKDLGLKNMSNIFKRIFSLSKSSNLAQSSTSTTNADNHNDKAKDNDPQEEIVEDIDFRYLKYAFMIHNILLVSSSSYQSTAVKGHTTPSRRPARLMDNEGIIVCKMANSLYLLQNLFPNTI